MNNTYTELEKAILDVLKPKVSKDTFQALKYGNVLKNLIAGCEQPKNTTPENLAKEICKGV